MEKEDVLAQFRKIYECGICLNVVCNPKNLACGHAFCQRCLDRILKFRAGGSATIKCPNGCEAETVISATETTNGLPSNFMLKSALDLLGSRTNNDRTKEECEHCPRVPVKYCIKCCEMTCAECADFHDDSDETKFHDSFVSVNFDNNDKSGVVYCKKHNSEVGYECSETQQLVCTYCMHRGALSPDKYVSLPEAELSLKNLMQQKIDKNSDYKKRREEAVQVIMVAKEKLKEELEIKKAKCLMDYYTQLSKEELKVLDEFKQVSKEYLAAFDSLQEFEYLLSKDEFDFRLSWWRSKKQLMTKFMNNNEAIPGVRTHLEDKTFDGAYPLGSLKQVYCAGNSCKNFKGDFIGKPVELCTSSARFRQLAEFVRVVDDKELGCNVYGADGKGIENESEEKGSTEETLEPKSKWMKLDEKPAVYNVNDPEDHVESNCVEVTTADPILNHQCQPEPVVSFPLKSIRKTIAFSFKICNFSRIFHDAVFSEPIKMQQYVLTLKLAPKIDYDARRRYASIYLRCTCSGYNETWSLPIDFKLTVKKSTGSDVVHNFATIFTEKKDNRGWRSILRWDEVMDPRQGYLVNDSLSIQASVSCDLLSEK